MSRRLQAKPDGGYFGHGLSIIEEFPSTNSSELDSLQAENQQLREQLQYQQQLLAIWQQPPCALCQVQDLGTSTTASSTTDSRFHKNTKSRCSADASGGDQAASNSCSTSHSNVNKAFRQQQVLIAQLQRQVMILEVELSSREQLALEADAVLAECCRRLGPFVALQDKSAAGGSRSGGAPASRPGLSSTTLDTATRQTSSTGQRSSNMTNQQGGPLAAAAGVGTSGSGASAADLVLQHAQGLHSWCSSTIARLGRARAESAAKCKAARKTALIANSAISGAGTTESWGTGSDGSSSLQQLQLQYAAPGGNRFLQPGTTLHLAAIARGQASSALNAAVLLQLTPQLAGLAQGLATLAVQLRTIVLPAMPWLSTAAAQQITSNAAALAGESAFAAAQLTEACSVLPAVVGTLSGPAAAAERKRLVHTAAAEQQADWWGAVESPCGRESAAEEVQQLLQIDPKDARLFQSLSNLVASSKVAKAGGSMSGTVAGSTSSSRKSISLGGSCNATKHHQNKEPDAQQQLGSALLQQLQQRWAVLWSTKQVLEQQLSFVARCSSEQAKVVSSLTQEVVAALTSAVEQSELQHGLQQQRLGAQQLIQQIQRAMVLLQQRSGEVSARGNAERTLIGLLQQQQPVLDNIPELLSATSAQSIKAAALGAVTAVFKQFSAGVRTARADTEALSARLRSAELNMRSG